MRLCPPSGERAVSHLLEADGDAGLAEGPGDDDHRLLGTFTETRNGNDLLHGMRLVCHDLDAAVDDGKAHPAGVRTGRGLAFLHRREDDIRDWRQGPHDSLDDTSDIVDLALLVAVPVITCDTTHLSLHEASYGW